MAVLPNGLETTELGRTAWREVQNQNFILLDNFIGNVRVTAENVSLDTATFNNNLDNTITDVQKLAEAVDELSSGSGGDGVDYNNTPSATNSNLTPAMPNISTGTYNTALGNQSLGNLSTGFRNSSFGYSSSGSLSSSFDNSSFGYQSLKKNTSYFNSAFGSNRLSLNTTGNTNSAFGVDSQMSNTIGNENSSFGKNSLRDNISGSYNCSIGVWSLAKNTTGTYNTALGNNRGRYLISGSSNFNSVNTTTLGYDARTSADNQVQLGNSSTTTYAYGRVQDRSDVRDKRNIEPTTLGLEFINKIEAVQYQLNYREDYNVLVKNEDGTTEIVKQKNDGSKTRTRKHQGVKAQQVKEVMEEMGVDFGGYQDHSLNGGDDVKSIGYQEFIAPLIKSVQELTFINKQLMDRIEILEDKEI